MLEIGRAKAPRSHDAHRLVGERARQWRKEISRDLDGAVEHEDQTASGDANERVAGGTLAEIAVGEVDLDAWVASGDLGDLVLGFVARARIEDKDLAFRRQNGEHSSKTASEIGRVLARDDADGP